MKYIGSLRKLYKIRKLPLNFPISVTLIYILQLCTSTVIVKYNRTTFDLTIKLKTRHSEDPIDRFKLRSRRILCDAVLNAKHFLSVYDEKDTSNVNMFTFYNMAYNYQRAFLSAQVQDPEALYYTPRHIRLSGGARKVIKLLQCINLEKTEWFVTFGMVYRFMFLVERKEVTRQQKFISAIIEPTPIFPHPQPDEQILQNYFLAQLHSKKGKLESVCRLAKGSNVRLCSSAFDALISKGYFEEDVWQINYVRSHENCHSKHIEIHSTKHNFFSLPCSINRTHLENPQFHVLADAQEPGSIFIFFPTEKKSMVTLYTRLRKVGALLNPSEKRKQR